MHEAYKHMMEQQNPLETPAQLFESLDSAPVRKMPVYKKVLLAVACLFLLIPTAVLAAENIFDVSIVRIGPRKDLEGNDALGYNIDFVTTKEISLDEIGEKWRYPEEGVESLYESWQTFQTDLGFDLLDNPVLEQEYDVIRSHRIKYYDPGAPCAALFRSYEGQLYSFSATASYKKNSYRVTLSTDALVEHPNIPQEVKDVFTAVQYLLDDESDLEKFSTEEYTASSGLTATLLTYNYGDGIVSYDAYFRANGVRYKVSMFGDLDDPEWNMREEMIRILEAFTME